MKFWTRMLALLLSLWSSSAIAQDDVTFSTRAVSTTAGGNLTSCEFIFSAIGKDYRSRQGGDISVSGNLSTFVNKNSVIFGLKLTIDDFVSGNLVTAKIAQTHLVSADGVIWNSDDKYIMDGELPGSKLHALFLGDESKSFIDGFMDGRKFKIGFNREAGTSDVNVEIDPQVESFDRTTGVSVRNKKNIDAFIACFYEILNKAVKSSPQD